jgi:flagellar motor component MotA
MKMFGLAICLSTLAGAAITVGIHLYLDIMSLLFVFGGAAGFAVMKKTQKNYMTGFGDGAVYFGWLGALVGLIAIAGDRFFVWGDVDKMGPALAVAMLSVLYGYALKLVTVAFEKE